MEHWTLKLLINTNENGELFKTPLAEELSKKYEEIMVDEYQDINEIQDLIFKAVSKSENNIFMVGDVKQSIYKFRQSKPGIFLKKKNLYNQYCSSASIFPAKIILKKNFRSNENIISFINYIFSKLMSEKAGELEYTGEEILVPGADLSIGSEPEVLIKIIDTSKIEEKEEEDVLEAQVIAETIAKMIGENYKVGSPGAERSVTYSDFCILMRSCNNHAHIYSRELNNCGVPCTSESSAKFLETSEIAAIISLLKVIDNPIQDIPLISAMLSPIFGFSLEDLGKIRLEERGVPFYFALKKSARNGNIQALNFMREIEDYRNIAANIPCCKLIDYIYSAAQYIALAETASNGARKKANLLLLMDYAQKYDEEYHSGLSGFLNFIENIQRKGADLPASPEIPETSNSVKIMSIHKSKGLEFPVCIVAGCSKKFNFDTNSIIIHPQLGLGFKLKDENNIVQYDNPIRQAIYLQNKKEDISEELRILYVALTRAKEKLIVLLSLKDTEKTLAKNLILYSHKTVISPYAVWSGSSFSEWIIMALSQSCVKNELYKLAGMQYSAANEATQDLFSPRCSLELAFNRTELPENNSEAIHIAENRPEYLNSHLIQKLERRFNFNYGNPELINTPLKISASKLVHDDEWKKYIASSSPAFISGENFSNAEKGSALHKFLCWADFVKAAENLESELMMLIQKGFLTPEEAQCINKLSLQKFFGSNIFQRMIKSSSILREYRFSVNVPIKEIKSQNFIHSSSNDSIFIQGALDCAFLESGKYVIIDYKTDKTNDVKNLYEKYAPQLETYKYALQHACGAEVKELCIYSFHLNDYFLK